MGLDNSFIFLTFPIDENQERDLIVGERWPGFSVENFKEVQGQ